MSNKASKSKSPQPKSQELTHTFEDELRSLTQLNNTSATPQKSQKNTPKANASPAQSKGNKSVPASAQKQKTPLKSTPVQQEENNDTRDLEQEFLNEISLEGNAKQATPKGSIQKSNKNTPQIKGSEQKSKKSLPPSAQKSVSVPDFEPEVIDDEIIVAEEKLITPPQSAKKSAKNTPVQKSAQKQATPVKTFEEAVEEKQVTPQKSVKNTPVQKSEQKGNKSQPASAKKSLVPSFAEEVVVKTPSAKKSVQNTSAQRSAQKQATPVKAFEELVPEKQVTPQKSNKNTPVQTSQKKSLPASAQKPKTPVQTAMELEEEEEEEVNDEINDQIEEEVEGEEGEEIEEDGENGDEDDDDDLGLDNFDEEDLQVNENEDEEDEEVEDEEKQRKREENKRKAIEFRENQGKKGVIYLSSVPPYMKVSQLRKLFGQYNVERIYLTPEDESKRKFRAKTGGNKRRSYTEGWMEFQDKKVAKYVAAVFNNQKIGGKRRSFYTEDTLNLKYLPKFKWENLTEKMNYDTKVRKEKMRNELALAKKQHDYYLDQVEKGKKIMGIKKSKDAKRAAMKDIEEVLHEEIEEEEPEMKMTFDDEKDRIRRVFRQKKPKTQH